MDTGLQTRINESISQANKGTLTTDALIRLVNDCIDQSPDRDIVHQFLDLAHFQEVAKIISAAGLTEDWLERIIQLIDHSQFHVGYMIEQRAQRYGEKTVFNMIHGDDLTTLSYQELWSKIQMTGKALSVLEKPEEPPVIGLLTHNQLNGALVDLACLSFGVRVIPIPLNSTSEHLSFILKQSEISHLFVGGKTGVRLWNEIQQNHDISLP